MDTTIYYALVGDDNVVKNCSAFVSDEDFRIITSQIPVELVNGFWKKVPDGHKVPSIGWIYDSDCDIFIEPKPHPSWILDENHVWIPPVPIPQNNSGHIGWRWNEDSISWIPFEQ